MGEVPQLKLDELVDNDYPVTERGFKALIKTFIKELCLDKNAKGTLKQSIEQGAWTKPKDTEIKDHNQKVQHLFKWVDQVPGFYYEAMTEMEKFRLYVETFLTKWAKQFIVVRGITDATSYQSINEFMQQQKEDADWNKAMKKKENDKINPHKKNNQNGGKFKLDPKATDGPRTRCKRFPNAKNSWGN